METSPATVCSTNSLKLQFVVIHLSILSQIQLEDHLSHSTSGAMRHDAPLGALRLRLSAGRVGPLSTPSRFALLCYANRRVSPSTAPSISKATTPQRLYSSAPAPQQRQQQEPPPKEYSSPPTFPQAANPPATTRPPPLDLPTRDPAASTFSHLFNTGKAYLTFYKTGLSQIHTNTRLLYPNSKTDRADIPPPASRGARHLRARWTHDIRRLPVFALLLVVCGETTPLVVLAVPSIVPFTCRIPAQVKQIQRKLEARRARSAAEFQAAGQDATGAVVAAHLARSLGVISPVWDRLGLLPDRVVAGRVQEWINHLVEDDGLLEQAGGVDALVDEEVPLACVDRGLDVVGRSEQGLRQVLARWLYLTRSHGMGDEETAGRMVALLTRREEDWPAKWDQMM
ncbi:hypothetical protein B0T22DRAFT_181339 [Podospora appendiculata]|uniref:Letm1 RBD domain-containing protein n=1 Tax=Podospora appendiculata TaxID=314037 RepID=A0AAE0XC59_9PEZI|nr:hypothetical protein B0T22DRAFT_181339 [Podospora appendiculata]